MSNSEAVYFNGNYSPKNQTSLSILDRGFLFGDGVYELIPVYNKHIFYILIKDSKSLCFQLLQ